MATATAGNAATGAATGGNGGNGGTNTLDAGSFSMSNTMGNVATSAAGILMLTQQTGISGLVQQSVNVQATVNAR
jgi:hypothetical protein